jgi:Holliday junction resolvasome RuvABC endonuclease subunit
MYIVGIDPGLSGAIGVIDDSGKFVFVVDAPVVEVAKPKGKSRQYSPLMMCTALRETLKGGDGVHAFIEEQQAMPGQGVKSMFTIGLGFGLWLGAMAALGIPHTRVRPATWKKALWLGKDKSISILRAQQIFPTAPIQLKKHDGRAEALLLAWYGLRMAHGSVTDGVNSVYVEE